MRTFLGRLGWLALVCVPVLSADTVTITGSYNSTVYGNGLAYMLNTRGNGTIQSTSLTGSPVTLNSTAPFIYSGCLVGIPADYYISGATLNLNVAPDTPTA